MLPQSGPVPPARTAAETRKRWHMAEFLIILLVVGAFLGIFYLVSVIRDRRLLRDEQEEEPHDRKAA
jgi:uncharacterized membrane protein YqjE